MDIIMLLITILVQASLCILYYHIGKLAGKNQCLSKLNKYIEKKQKDMPSDLKKVDASKLSEEEATSLFKKVAVMRGLIVAGMLLSGQEHHLEKDDM